jgi:predicted MFS family arabinose efflux permease
VLRKGAPAPLWLLCIAGFLVMADGRVITPLLPAIERDFHTSAGTAGLTATTYIAAYAAFQLCYGPFGDRLGKVRVIRVALLVFTLGTGLCAAMPDLNSLLAMRALTGISAAAVVPMGLAYIGDTVAIEHRQKAISLFLSCMIAGSAGSQVLGGLLAQFASWRSVFIVFAVAAAVPALLFQRAGVDAPSTVAGQGHFARYREVLGRAPGFYGVCVWEGFVFWGASAYLGAVLVDDIGSSYVVAGLLLGVMGAASVLTARAQGRRTGVGRERQRFRSGSVLYAVGTAMVAALGAVGGAWPAWFAVAAVLLGVGLISAHSTLQVRATEVAPEVRATATSLFSCSLNIGGASGSALAGVVVDGPGYPVMWAACAVLVAVLAFVGPLALPRRDRAADPGLSPAPVAERP